MEGKHIVLIVGMSSLLVIIILACMAPCIRYAIEKRKMKKCEEKAERIRQLYRQIAVATNASRSSAKSNVHFYCETVDIEEAAEKRSQPLVHLSASDLHSNYSATSPN